MSMFGGSSGESAAGGGGASSPEPSFNEFIAQALRRLGLSEHDAADRFHTAPHVIRLWVEGKARPTPGIQRNIRRALADELRRVEAGGQAPTSAVADGGQFTF